jgi:cytochrome c oxidase subunit 1
MNDRIGQLHAILTFIFFNAVFFPMHFLGVGGMMRRIYNPTQYEFLQSLQPIGVFMSVCAFILGACQILFIGNFVGSLIWGRKAERNPWQANTLEWTAPSPPPHGNWGATIPTVYRGAYEYSSPEVAEDFLPQDRQLAPVAPGGRRP